MTGPMYKLGQRVRVTHCAGDEWEGEITYVANAGDTEDAWEYEVSNAPIDRYALYQEDVWKQPGWRWHPLLWEHEIVEIIR